MSLSAEVKITGDVTTPEHQEAVKSIMDAVDQALSNLPGIGYQVKGSRWETKTSMTSRPLMADGLINPEPFPAPVSFMHEVKMQFGFHLNPVAKPAESAVDCPDKQD